MAWGSSILLHHIVLRRMIKKSALFTKSDKVQLKAKVAGQGRFQTPSFPWY